MTSLFFLTAGHSRPWRALRAAGLALLAGLLTAAAPAASAASGTGAAGAAAAAMVVKPKIVYLITNRGCEEVCRSFQHSLSSQGPVSFVLRDIDGDVARMPPLIAEARRLHPDLIATWGSGITLAVVGPYDAADRSRYIDDIPVIYMYVGNPVESKIARDLKKSGRPNVAGANTAVPMSAQLNLVESYRKVRKVGMLYNTNEPAAVAQADDARQNLAARGIEVIEVKLPPRADGKPDADDIPGALSKLAEARPDFLYNVGSTFTLQQISQISNGAIALGVPMFSSAESAFRKGEILLGLISPLAGIGQVSAYQAGQVLFHDQQPGDLSTPTLTRHSVLINMKAARVLQLYPPMKMLQFAEISE